MDTTLAATGRKWLRRRFGPLKRRWFGCAVRAGLRLHCWEGKGSEAPASTGFRFGTPESVAVGNEVGGKPNVYLFEQPSVRAFPAGVVDLVGGVCWVRTPFGFTEVNLQDAAAFEEAINRHWRQMLRLGDRFSTMPLAGPVAPLLHVFGRCFYHWQLECLARIEGIREYERRTGTAVQIVVPKDYPAWVADTLDAVGWPRSRLLVCDQPCVSCETLVIASNPCQTRSLFTAPSACRWLKAEVLGRLPAPSNIGPTVERVYITRRRARTRRLRNEQDIIPLLAKAGIAVVDFETMPLAEQARIIRQARLVIAPHGAGLTNIVFGDRLTVFEIHSSGQPECYRNLAAACGHHYRLIAARQSGIDIIVDPSTLLHGVTQLISAGFPT